MTMYKVMHIHEIGYMNFPPAGNVSSTQRASHTGPNTYFQPNKRSTAEKIEPNFKSTAANQPISITGCIYSRFTCKIEIMIIMKKAGRQTAWIYRLFIKPIYVKLSLSGQVCSTRAVLRQMIH